MLKILNLLILALFLPVMAFAAPQGLVRVVDADTLDVGGVRVRLHGIDAPESSQRCRTEQKVAWDCGAWAAAWADRAFAGKQAECEALDTDQYGRVVATCRIDGQDVGEALVSNGVAFAYRKYSTRYVPAEDRARARMAGLMGMQVQSPAQFRLIRTAGKLVGSKECAIKGNISRSGEKIYHMPGQKYYSKTKISPSKGERWFCSEADAQRAGWRKAKV
ncbi:thermonuclease family protein [Thalassovita mangrovi]|uniref:Thermonuclease family protein n=1 Tax=Thalassovita mangrovi TaxID=2692236 RepID=A0A6L8LLP1_9RHOB|nr:thermonuclease family protein [Thalassovita mangrovi]MYM56553.1 thermonuclease family protein [Thalassovita mangrovi]